MAHALAERALAYFDDLFPDELAPVQVDPVTHHPDDIIDEISRFSAFGSETLQEQINGIPYYTNEFWTSGQRKGHSIHEVSYRACFKPQLPEFFIKRLTNPGDAVHDPFMGRGTTPIQAALMGRKPFANDINPLSKILTRPRLAPPSISQVDAFLANLPWDRPVDIREDLLAFYHPRTLCHLTVLKEELERRAPLDDETPDPIVDWVRMIAVNRLTGHSPGFFSVYTLPPNQAVSVSAQQKINEKRGQTPPIRDIRKIIIKKTRTLLKDGVPRNSEETRLLTGAADATAPIPSGSVSLVVTSPPFLDIVQYADDNWLRCWFAGIDASSIQIAMHKSESAWEEMIKRVLTEQARILKPGGHVAFEVGEVRGGKVLLERLVWSAAISLPFERLGVVVNQQEFTKTANCWGVSNNRGGTNTNRIVLLRRNSGQ